MKPSPPGRPRISSSSFSPYLLGLFWLDTPSGEIAGNIKEALRVGQRSFTYDDFNFPSGMLRCRPS
ncbi:hypothetical protein QCA50_004109 [Cerrena zonata]|uniref:Uncharacterized protein n=1 Tax=Cerrena zonata TaxID=2478898 RepID=A0AAW0GSH9_9APHY